jgi:hypothetical protein
MTGYFEQRFTLIAGRAAPRGISRGAALDVAHGFEEFD